MRKSKLTLPTYENIIQKPVSLSIFVYFYLKGTHEQKSMFQSLNTFGQSYNYIFVNKKHRPFWNTISHFLVKEMSSIYARMFFSKFSLNWLSNSREGRFLKNKSSKYCLLSFINPPPLLKVNPLPNDACAMFGYNFLNSTLQLCYFNYYLLFEKGVIFNLEGWKTLYPMCLVLLKLAQRL